MPGEDLIWRRYGNLLPVFPANLQWATALPFAFVQDVRRGQGGKPAGQAACVAAFLLGSIAPLASLAAGTDMAREARSDGQRVFDQSRDGFVQSGLERRDHRGGAPTLHGRRIFIPPFSRSAIGREAVSKAYDNVFKERKFNVRFEVAELVQMALAWACVRRTRPEQRPTRRLARPPPKRTRSCSSSGKVTTGLGGSRATASLPRTRPAGRLAFESEVRAKSRGELAGFECLSPSIVRTGREIG